MASGMNSERRFQRGTYTPTKIDPSNPNDVALADRRVRGVEKTNYLTSLEVLPTERVSIERRIAEIDPEERGVILGILASTQARTNLVVSSEVAQYSARSLVRFGRIVTDWRRLRANEIAILIDKLPVIRSHGEATGPVRTMPVNVSRTTVARPDGLTTLSLRVGTLASEPLEPTTIDVARSQPEVIRELEIASASVEARRILRPEGTASLRNLDVRLVAVADATMAAVDGFEERMRVEPIGRLHLERLCFVPVGLDRGEVVHTVPLAPKETVNISHREWSLRSEEFERMVQDSFEGYSEQGVTEKNDLSQSSENQARHGRTLSMSASASYFGVSGSVSYGTTSDDSQSQRDARNQSIEVTRKASSRAKKEHKMSFKVSSVAGTEDQQVRVLTNPSETAAMRVDYHQLVRKWRVDLYRYAIRMTYDLVIPGPGADLVRDIAEIQTIDALLEQPFEFDLPLSGLTTANWADLAVRYRASVEPPPDLVRHLHVHKELPVKAQAEWRIADRDVLELEVDPDYEISTASFDATYSHSVNETRPTHFDIRSDDDAPTIGRLDASGDLPQLIGKSGRLLVVFEWVQIRSGSVFAEVVIVPRAATIERWRFLAWTSLRQAAEESFNSERQHLRDRKARLQEQIARWDSLTLRQREREEVMKGVLRWLFGPSFDLVPDEVERLFATTRPGVTATIDPRRIDGRSWQRVLEFGEFIKFVQHAIEWESVVFFAYPYFWDTPVNWDLKRQLEHPDALHQNFLRAGSARVVLTIRPGFEQSFAALIETGALGSLSQDHPYVTIAEEIQAFAATSYPGIPAPMEGDAAVDASVVNDERGVLIGQWYEHTPTSALDISINTPLSDLI